MRAILFRKLVVAGSILLAAGCGRQEIEQMRKYYRHETEKRMQAAREISPADTLLLRHVHDQVASLILLSKDVENGRAARNRSVRFFDSLSSYFEMNRDDFQDIHAGQSAIETEMQLRENELAFADRLLMKRDTSGKMIFTAH